jgi:hypothetical protein
MSQTQNGVLQRDDNGYPVMGGVSTADGVTVLDCEINPSTGRLRVESASGGGTGTWWAVTGTINGSNVTFSIATQVGSDFVLLLNRQPQQQDIGVTQWDYSYVASGGSTTITYHTAPDSSLNGTPHAAFVIS